MLKRNSIADQAYRVILADILSCRLFPGSQIAQSQLMESYDYGITPVREALKRLESEGYVRTVPRFGYIITPVTIKDVEDIYELRTILEQASVRLAILRATDSQLAQLDKYTQFTYVYKDVESYQDFLDQNNALHHSIAVMGGNRKLADSLLDLLIQMTRIFNLGLDLRDSSEELRDEHFAFIRAVQSRDVDLAVKLVAEQINIFRLRVIQKISQKIDSRLISDYDFIQTEKEVRNIKT